ncbi:MAG: hypothetical protein JXD18_12910 [Anaerolineae bacterium]|nr:hypothetical protein [Anaerolineae bacterium]
MGTQTGQVWEIKVQGALDPQWAEWFNGMTITAEGADDGLPVTTLTGPVADQAALRGILCKLWDLNLTLISARRVETDGEGE